MIPRFSAFLAMVWIAAAAGAASAGTLTLDAAVRYAFAHSEQLHIVRATADTLRASGNQATAFTKPQLALKGRYLEMDTNQPEIPIPELNPGRREIFAGLQASQVLFAGGRIKNSWQLKDRLNTQADLLEKTGRRDIRQDVTRAYVKAMFQAAVLQILQDRLAQRKEELADAQDVFAAGMVTSLDVRQAQLNLNFAKEALEAGQADWQRALIDLNRAMGRRAAEDLLEPSQHLRAVDHLADQVTRLRQALASGKLLDLQVAQTAYETADRRYRIEKGRHIPEFLLVAGGESSGDQSSEMYEAWQVGLQLQWDLYTGGAIRAAADAAAARRMADQQNIGKVEKSLAATVAAIASDVDSALKRTGLQIEAVDLSKANYEDARGQYRAGTITLTRLGEFNLRYAEARFNLQVLYFRQQNLDIAANALLAWVPPPKSTPP